MYVHVHIHECTCTCILSKMYRNFYFCSKKKKGFSKDSKDDDYDIKDEDLKKKYEIQYFGKTMGYSTGYLSENGPFL